MFCPNCGAESPDDARFCVNCGTPFDAAPAAPGAQETPLDGSYVPEAPGAPPPQRPSPNIELCADGVYRWFYPFDMLRNPVILFTVWRVLGISFGIVYAFVVLVNLFGGSGLDGLGELTLGFGILIAVFLVIGFLAYLIVAKMYGWRYLVIFEMNEDGVRHIQMPEQFERAQALALISLLAARSSPGAVGTGLLAASKSESYVRFGHVRGVRILRRSGTIKINERLEHSQVYAQPEDFDFVQDYILSHIPPTTKVRG